MHKNSGKTIAKIPRKIFRSWVNSSHRILSFLDDIFFTRDADLLFPPIFIVGAPRSGTTLFYQILIQFFETAYFPNIANTFYRCPLTATRLGLLLCPPYRSRFHSTFGFEKGCLAPSEAGNIWNRWFPHEGREGFNYTPEGYLKEADRRAVFRTVAHVENLFHAPFLSKNVKMSVRIPALYEIFPGAIFLHIQRNPVHAAVSILRIRRQNKLDWWSVMPREIDWIKSLPEVEQVCHQVFGVEANLREDLQKYFPGKFLTISYDYLCREPGDAIKRVSAFAHSNGISLTARKGIRLPGFSPAKVRPDSWVSEEEIRKINEILSELESKQAIRE